MDPIQKVQLTIGEILRQVSHTLYKPTELNLIELEKENSCRNAITKAHEALSVDHPITFRRPRTRKSQQLLKSQAQKQREISQSQAHGPFAVRNALPASQLPSPKTKVSAATSSRLKENVKIPEDLERDPYAKATIDESMLACLPAKFCLSAIESDGTDERVELTVNHCLFDTGAHYSIISADRVPQSFMDQDIHDDYRNIGGKILCQAAGMFSFTGKLLEKSTIVQIWPLELIPNKRSGVILGQRNFIEDICYRSTPRAILEKRGETVDEGIWEDIDVEGYINDDGDYHNFSSEFA